jgi:hypothetical protein
MLHAWEEEANTPMQERVIGAFKQVIGFLTQGMEFNAHDWQAFEIEMRALIEPHMPVLVHRRIKLLDGSDGASWWEELDRFMDTSLWPLLGDDRDYADRNRTFVTLMLDIAISEEQGRRAAQGPDQLPSVARFGSAWVS